MSDQNYNQLVTLLSSEKKDLILSQFKKLNLDLEKRMSLLHSTLLGETARDCVKAQFTVEQNLVAFKKLEKLMPAMYTSLLRHLFLHETLNIPQEFVYLFKE